MDEEEFCGLMDPIVGPRNFFTEDEERELWKFALENCEQYTVNGTKFWEGLVTKIKFRSDPCKYSAKNLHKMNFSVEDKLKLYKCFQIRVSEATIKMLEEHAGLNVADKGQEDCGNMMKILEKIQEMEAKNEKRDKKQAAEMTKVVRSIEERSNIDEGFRKEMKEHSDRRDQKMDEMATAINSMKRELTALRREVCNDEPAPNFINLVKSVTASARISKGAVGQKYFNGSRGDSGYDADAKIIVSKC